MRDDSAIDEAKRRQTAEPPYSGKTLWQSSFKERSASEAAELLITCQFSIVTEFGNRLLLVFAD